MFSFCFSEISCIDVRYNIVNFNNMAIDHAVEGTKNVEIGELKLVNRFDKYLLWILFFIKKTIN